MDSFNQSEEFKNSIAEQVNKKACLGMDDASEQEIGDFIALASRFLVERLLREWAYSLDPQELSSAKKKLEEVSQLGIVEIFERMNDAGLSNPLEVVGQILSDADASVEELPEGSLEEIDGEPLVIEVEEVQDGTPESP